MRITELQRAAKIVIWLKHDAAAILQRGKDGEMYYELRYPCKVQQFKLLVGTVDVNDVENKMLRCNVIPGGPYYVSMSHTHSGYIHIPYTAIMQLRVNSEVAEFPPTTRYRSNRLLIGGLTYYTSEIVSLAW